MYKRQEDNFIAELNLVKDFQNNKSNFYGELYLSNLKNIGKLKAKEDLTDQIKTLEDLYEKF